MGKFDSNQKLARVEDIPEGHAIVVMGPEGLSIALFKLNGEIFALENVCPHMGGPLGEGEIEDGYVTCPWHAWKFDIKDGACENMPGDDAKKIDVVVEDGNIYLNSRSVPP